MFWSCTSQRAQGMLRSVSDLHRAAQQPVPEGYAGEGAAPEVPAPLLRMSRSNVCHADPT